MESPLHSPQDKGSIFSDMGQFGSAQHKEPQPGWLAFLNAMVACRNSLWVLWLLVEEETSVKEPLGVLPSLSTYPKLMIFIVVHTDDAMFCYEYCIPSLQDLRYMALRLGNREGI